MQGGLLPVLEGLGMAEELQPQFDGGLAVVPIAELLQVADSTSASARS